MITFEALMNEAKERGMPGGKTRGILREYLQVLALKELYKTPAGKCLYFTGGTYLRLVHGSRRFSEDLDFNAVKLKKKDFEDAVRFIAKALLKEGFVVKTEFKYRRKLLIGGLIFPDAEEKYGIVSKYSKKEGIVLKVEANLPSWKVVPETLLISGFGQMFPVFCTQKEALFSDKIDALIKKNRARHLYDIIFMLSKEYPIDAKILKLFGIAKNPLTVIKERVDSFTTAELKKQAEDLRPFLFDETEAELLINAKTIISQLIEKYKSNKGDKRYLKKVKPFLNS